MFHFMAKTKGTQQVTKTALAKIAVPDRSGIVSERWQGIAHKEIVEQVLTLCEANKYKIQEERWATSSDGHDLFGSIVLQNPKGRDFMPKGIGPALGVVHSNMGRYSLRLVAGAQVFVCANGLVTMRGELVLARKHTSGVDLQESFKHGFELWEKKIKEIPAFVSKFQKTTISTARADELLLKAGREEVLPWEQIGKVDHEWRNPRHSDFKPRTAWSLYNSFTEVLKTRPVQAQIKTFRWLAPTLMGEPVQTN